MKTQELKRSYGRNVWLLAGIWFFSNLVFQRGIFMLYLMKVGLSNTQISVLQVSLFIFNFLAEAPTGMFGDRFGRRWSIFAGLLLAFVNAVGMALCEDFGLFLALFIINGVGFAFRSGSGTALLYDSLKVLHREGEYVRILSRITALSSLSLAIAMFVGGFMVTISWSVVFLSYAVCVVIAMILTLIMFERTEDYRPDNFDKNDCEHTNREWQKNVCHLKAKSTKNFFGSPGGRRLLLFMVGIGLYEAVTTPYYIYGQKLFHFYGLKVSSISIIFSIIQIVTSLTYLSAEYIGRRIPLRGILAIVFIGSTLLIAANAVANLTLSLVVFFVIMTLPGIADVLMDEYIQKRIPSRIRATLLSWRVVVGSALVSLGYLVFGVLLDHFAVNMVIAMTFFVPLISLVICEWHFAIEKRANNEQ